MTALKEFDAEVWEQESIHKIISRAMARPDAATFKFSGQMVRDSKPLWDWAEYLVDHYCGSFELMTKFRTEQRTNGRQLSENQLAVALNTMLRCWKRSLDEVKRQQQQIPSNIADVPVNLANIPMPSGEQTHPFKQQVKRPIDGTYTFVDANGDYRVIRFRSSKNNGQTYISYQYGPDNTADFAKCGKIDADNNLIVWGSAFPKGDGPAIDLDKTQRADLYGAIVFLCSFDKEGQLAAGEAYALKSGNCFICNRELTVPSSISAGIGPVCASKWGV